MIRLGHALRLARAKLHTKRVMLMITVVVSGLLFGVLYGASVLVTGINQSAADYTRTALDGKYMVKSNPVIPEGVYGINFSEALSREKINEMQARQGEYLTRQKAAAKRLGVAFDEKSVAPILVPDPFADPALPADRKVRPNFESPVYQEYIDSLQIAYAKTAKNKLSDLKALAAGYGATEFTQNQRASVSFSDLVIMPEGKEDPAKYGPNARPQNGDMSMHGYLTHSARNSQYTVVDATVIKRFVLAANEQRRANAKAIPVVLTVDEAVAMLGKQLGLPEKPAGVSAQLAWMKDVHSKINGATYTACYRNRTEADRLAKITRDAITAEEFKNDKTYVGPGLQYNLPSEACGAITVKQDKRAAEEKQAEQAEIALGKAAGTYTEPRRQKLTFVVVGVMPVSPQETAMTSVRNFMNSLLGAHYGEGAMIPRDLYMALPSADRHEDILTRGSTVGSANAALAEAGLGEVVVAFPKLEQARAFIEREGCSILQSSSECKKLFYLEAYGSNYLLLDDISKLAAQGMRIALPVAVAIATIIIAATMARVMIDSRRETAVFRAIGARREHMMTVYLLYCLLVAMRIVAFSLALGLGGALVVQALYGGLVTDYAKVAYGVFDKGQAFSFVGFDPRHLLWLVGGVMGVSLVAVLPSLVRNLRRSPISDMREE